MIITSFLITCQVAHKTPLFASRFAPFMPPGRCLSFVFAELTSGKLVFLFLLADFASRKLPFFSWDRCVVFHKMFIYYFPWKKSAILVVPGFLIIIWAHCNTQKYTCVFTAAPLAMCPITFEDPPATLCHPGRDGNIKIDQWTYMDICVVVCHTFLVSQTDSRTPSMFSCPPFLGFSLPIFPPSFIFAIHP